MQILKNTFSSLAIILGLSLVLSCQSSDESSKISSNPSPDVNASEKSDTLGEQRTAFLLVDLIEDGTAQSVEDIKEALFTGEFSVNKFLLEASYGRLWLKGDVFGWAPAKSIDRCSLTQEQVFALFNKQVKFKNYDRFFIFVNQPPEGCQNAGLGESSFGKQNLQTPQGKVRASYSHIIANYRFAKPKLPHQNLSYLTSTAVAHELGHSFGIYGHANLFDCGKDVITLNSVGCNQEAIADMFSIMSGESFFRPALHYNACHKEELKWFKPSEIRTITMADVRKGPITLDLNPYEKTADGLLTVKIALDKPIVVVPGKVVMSHLFLEYRTNYGFDKGLDDLKTALENRFRNIRKSPEYYPNSEAINTVGLQIRGGFYNNGRCTTTYAFDLKPNSILHLEDQFTLYDNLDSFLNTGEAFTDPNNQLTVSVIKVNDNGSLKVSLAAYATR